VVIRPKNFKLSAKASRVLADPNKPDNKIIACALYLAATFPPLSCSFPRTSMFN